MKKILSSGLAIGAMISLVGCGGGSSSSTPTSTVAKEVTGQFIDAAVSGLNYTCAPSEKTGITNTLGEYTCNEGDTVTFSLGAYILGSTTASAGIVTPYELQADETTAVNIAQLLQTLDTNDTDDVITIPENFTALDNSTVELNATDFDTAIVDDLAELNVTALVGEGQAQNSMDADILTELFEGKTYYTIGGDNNMALLRVDFNNTVMTITDLTPGTTVEPMTQTYEIINDRLVTPDDYGTLAEHTADYIVMDKFTSGNVELPQQTLYVDLADAEHAYWTLYGITQEKLDDKTFYSYEYDDYYQEAIYAKMTFDAGTLTRTEVINGGTPETFTVSYEIIDGKIRVAVPAMDGDPSEYAWVTLLSETADSWLILDEGDNNQDGTIDWSSETTWYLTKPADYPDFTANTTSVDTTPTDTTSSSTVTTTLSVDPALVELASNKKIEIWHNISESYMSTLSTMFNLSTYASQSEILNPGNISCLDLGNFIVNSPTVDMGDYTTIVYYLESDVLTTCVEYNYLVNNVDYGSSTYARSSTL